MTTDKQRPSLSFTALEKRGEVSDRLAAVMSKHHENTSTARTRDFDKCNIAAKQAITQC